MTRWMPSSSGRTQPDRLTGNDRWPAPRNRGAGHQRHQGEAARAVSGGATDVKAKRAEAVQRVGVHGALSDEHYQVISTFIENRVGIRLPPNKRSMVEGRLRKRLKAQNIDSIEDYCNLLFEDGALGD